MRTIQLTRQEGEFLVDLLMLTDDWPARELDQELREKFGMVSQDEELKRRGKTLDGVRKEWANRINTR